ncbi:MAG: hypothetical protein V1929_01680 [bacterium]
MKRARKVDRKGGDGSALVMTLIITATVGIMGASLLTFADYQLGAMQRARQDNQAMAIAEAGANAALAIIKTDFANKDNTSLFPDTSYNDGTFDVTVTSVGDDKAQIKCVAVSGTSTQIVIVDVKDFSEGTPGEDPSSPWAHTIFINGNGRINGAGNCYGSVRCNQDLRTAGAFEWGTVANPVDVYCSVEFRANGSATLLGMVYAPSVSAPGGVPRTIQAVPTVTMPVLDLTPYYNRALANGQVFAGGTVSGSIGSIPGGVRWYNGAVTVNGGVNYAGCVIATGSINFKGGCTQTKVDSLPALVSRDGSVTLSGARTMQGLIYSASDLTANGAGVEDGTILVGGNLTLNGSYGLFTYNYSYPSVDGSPDASGSDVGVTAWQK